MLGWSVLRHVLALKSFMEGAFHFDHHDIVPQQDLMVVFFDTLATLNTNFVTIK